MDRDTLHPTMARNCGARPYKRVSVDLPVFAIAVLRKRAHERRESLSSVVEALILEKLMMDELQAMIADSPDFARVFAEWFRYATARQK